MNQLLSSEKAEYDIQAKKFCLDGEQYTGYGIRVHTDQGNFFDIDDLSTDRAAVEELAAKMNRGGLLPIHIGDVIEDFLG